MNSDVPATVGSVPDDSTIEQRTLRAILSDHQAPVFWRSMAQIATTFLPFFGLMAGMYALRGVSVWLTLALGIPAAGLIVRIFIIQHDCGHGAFFRNRAANEWLGRFCGLITMTPFANWRRHHANHHAVWNNLDKRSVGADIYSNCLTVSEFQAMSLSRRWWHRGVRHPLIAQLLLPPVVFVLLYRFPFDTPAAWRREWLSVIWTDVGLVCVFTTLVVLLGVGPVALVQLPTMALAAIIGAWIFSVQHRFEHSVWSRQQNWTATGAALHGSSYLRLPRVLQWFSSNIGFHHIHHLMPRVPNYRLEACHDALTKVVASTPPLTLLKALQGSGFALWDEELSRMVRFSDLRRRIRPKTSGH
jgi:omega-6 fatty acid desaturase (delta-12 desaturase)